MAARPRISKLGASLGLCALLAAAGAARVGLAAGAVGA